MYASSLMQLLDKSAFEDITISEICDNTSLSRRSFYNNYTSKDDVVVFLCESLMEEFIEIVQKKREFTLRKISMIFYEFGARHKEIFMVLINRNIFHIFAEALTKRITYLNSLIPNNILTGANEGLINYFALFHSAGVLKLFEHWLMSGMKESPNELSEIYVSIVRDTQQL